MRPIARCTIAVVFAFLVGARIANAECAPGAGRYASHSLFAGETSRNGSIVEARLAFGFEHRDCDRALDIRVGPTVSGVVSRNDTHATRYGSALGLGGEVEIDVGLASSWSIGGRLEASVGSGDFRQYLAGIRLRRGPFAVGIDGGAFNGLPEGQSMHDKMWLVGASVTSRTHVVRNVGITFGVAAVAGLLGFAYAMGSAH